MFSGKFEVGSVTVQAEINKGHSPEFWAEQATKKIVGSSYKHLGPIAEERAIVFREKVKQAIYDAVLGALRSDRQTIAGQMRDDGMETLAAQLLNYRIR